MSLTPRQATAPVFPSAPVRAAVPAETRLAFRPTVLLDYTQHSENDLRDFIAKVVKDLEQQHLSLRIQLLTTDQPYHVIIRENKEQGLRQVVDTRERIEAERRNGVAIVKANLMAVEEHLRRITTDPYWAVHLAPLPVEPLDEDDEPAPGPPPDEGPPETYADHLAGSTE